MEQAIDLIRKARAENPRYFYIHVWLAGALGLRGDVDEARVALDEAMKIEPRVRSIAQWRVSRPFYQNAQFAALAEQTLYAGLRRAGFPEE